MQRTICLTNAAARTLLTEAEWDGARPNAMRSAALQIAAALLRSRLLLAMDFAALDADHRAAIDAELDALLDMRHQIAQETATLETALATLKQG